LLILLMPLYSTAQQSSFSFQKLGLEDGLHDGTTRCICQDKYGYMWIGTVGALNRFDGKHVIQYTNIPGDTTSLFASQPRTIYTDKKGRLWIGFATGLAEYDFTKAIFKRIPSFKDIFIIKIISYNDSVLFIATRRGLVKYNTSNGQAFFYATSKQPEHAVLYNTATFDLALNKDSLFIATDRGLQVLDAATGKAQHIPVDVVADMQVYTLALDGQHNIWMGLHKEIKLVKLHADLKHTEVYDRFLTADYNTQPLNVMDILVDTKNRIWVVTAVDGLLQYMPATNSFVKHLHSSNLPNSPTVNYYRCIFQDNKGLIWLGCDFAGVNFFNPDKNIFKTILPFADRLNERARVVGRAVTEDKQGNIWMGNHDGVSRYNPATNTYTIWRNSEKQQPVLYNNIVRSLYCDSENNIWIGTASGVNRYNQHSGKMEFIDEKNLPGAFYNSITEDRSGNIWFCLNGSEVLYWYSTTEKKYHNVSEHPLLRMYKSLAATSYVMEDSKHRVWFSFSGKGVVMLDKIHNRVKHYMPPDSNGKGLVGNQIIDIKEDKDGIIWTTSLNGVTGINVDKDTYLSFTNKNGLPGNWASPLVVDSFNRVWIGVNGGLVMLHQDRKHLTTFSLSDGLPSVGFPEHAGIQMANGDIMMPTYNGFIRFNPADYKEEKTALDFYLSDYSVFDKKYTVNAFEDAPRLSLKPHENSFTFNLVAINFTTPSKTWFAYKLGGFENEWHYTQDAKAVYTNVPGGDYSFLYKASVNNTGWDEIVPKKVIVHLGTFFYKATWFWMLTIAILLVLLYMVYRYRIWQQQQLFRLKSKAESLEKEKTMIQYESLKQHLNPHFLFNSLTSLRSLIKSDSKAAAGFLDGLSKVYRYVLKSGAQELVLLQDEIGFVTTFAELQQVRFGDGLKVDIQVNDTDKGRFIAPVVLQNLVENAIKHNTTSTDEPLQIEIFTTDGYIVVRNNLQRYRIVETSNKSGLASLIKLYSFYTDKHIEILEDDHFFTVRIPLL